MQEEVRAQHHEEVAQRVRLNSVLGPQEIELRSRSSVRDDDSGEWITTFYSLRLTKMCKIGYTLDYVRIDLSSKYKF